METFKLVIKWLLLIGGVAFWLTVAITYIQPEEVIYNCELAEISPDFPPEVRNECRKLRRVKPISA